MKRSVAPVLVALVAGALLSVGSAAFAGGVTHQVSVGSADIFSPPGTDANFSLVANQRADGTVGGHWQDTFLGRGEPAIPVHIAIDCLVVVGNDAWVSGTITASTFAPAVGLPAITRVRDNGTSANDPADQVSFTFIDIGFDCNDQPDLPLFDLIKGQAKVR
jgi:hypothetical protein